MPYNAFIFDLDGTLLDSLADIADATELVLSEYGYPSHPHASYNQFVGNGLAKLLERAAPTGVATAQHASMLDRLRTIYADSWAVKTRPYPHIETTLDTLKKQGCNLMVLSNKDHSFTVDMVNHFFGGSLFDVVQGLKGGTPPKPDPQSALELCRQHGLDPAEVLFVGDMSVDLLTARNAAMPFAGANWGFRPAEVQQADHLLRTPADLLNLACEIPSTYPHY